ncbi:unnamed protein product [Ranitomeya imitator]|uniref:FYVE-type domain-containing protein n=1 Tax=Ranitomeya imitator TaxID=111125 RepID=A0ABN9M4L1_9NEOB|nr:unnamed protein product [Ranitomeya imitator]
MCTRCGFCCGSAAVLTLRIRSSFPCGVQYNVNLWKTKTAVHMLQKKTRGNAAVYFPQHVNSLCGIRSGLAPAAYKKSAAPLIPQRFTDIINMSSAAKHNKRSPLHQQKRKNMMNLTNEHKPNKIKNTKHVNLAGMAGYDEETKYAFVGDFSGQVTLLKLDTCSVISTLKGHEGGENDGRADWLQELLSITLSHALQENQCRHRWNGSGPRGSISCLYWDPVQRYLFSGSSDHSIILWDIGGRQGRTLILQGHHDKVQGLCYLQLTRQLVSCSVDGGICVWNMDVERKEAPQWLESDSCQKCAQPFFWNIKQMWDTRTMGLRQHHCRKCGQAVCGKCSSKRSSYPIMGFEFQVRVCDFCYESIKDEDRASLATFHEGKHNICFMTMDVSRGLMVTCGTDRLVKIWDMTPTVGCSLATGFSSR